MFGLNHFQYGGSLVTTDIYLAPVLVVGAMLLFWKNPNQLVGEFSPNKKHLAYMVVLTIIGLIYMNSITANDFLYFDF